MVNLESGERIVTEIRRHWYVLASESAFITFLAMLPFFALAVLGTLELPDGVFYAILFAISGWFLVLWNMFFVVWTKYYLDVWIITDRRIIDIEQIGLFSRDVSEFRLDRVQDATVQVNGILATLMKFGDLHVQTAGAEREFVVKKIGEPYKVKDLVMEYHDKAMKSTLQKAD